MARAANGQQTSQRARLNHAGARKTNLDKANAALAAGRADEAFVSRDGRRVYATNSLYASWDEIFYPDGVGAWAARIDADTETGGMAVDPRFFPHGDDFRGLRVHQTRLEGGDASSDSYCFVD
jgi:selenium-binding protein 1